MMEEIFYTSAVELAAKIRRQEVSPVEVVDAFFEPPKRCGESTPLHRAITNSEYHWRDESVLYELYWKQELSKTEIAEQLGYTQPAVQKWMQRFDIPRRDARETAPNPQPRPAGVSEATTPSSVSLGTIAQNPFSGWATITCNG